MKPRQHILVLGNRTASSDELLAALRQRAATELAAFWLLVPADPFAGGRTAARETLAAAVGRLRSAGLEVAGCIGAGDPIIAVSEAWDPRRYDEIIVATMPMRFSKWLRAALPERIRRLTGARVRHVVCTPKPTVTTKPEPHRAQRAPGSVTARSWEPASWAA